MGHALDVVTFGEAMALFAASETGPLAKVGAFTKRAAGAELNVAIGLARLGHSVGWISRLGRDSFGEYILEILEHEGIDISCVEVDDARPTGMMLKTQTSDGSDPKTEYYRKGSAASCLEVNDRLKAYALTARHLHLTGISAALGDNVRELSFCLARAMRAEGKTISFDPNLRPALWRTRSEMVETLNALAAHADIVMPGLNEGTILTGNTRPQDIAEYYLDLGASVVVVKLGEHGAYVRGATVEALIPGFTVDKVVDTVGAGDGFAVGFLSALLEGMTLEEAAMRGNWIGSRAIQVVGDSEGLPLRAELQDART